MNEMQDFTIIIPVYNEEENLLLLEKALVSYLPIAIKTTGILFVNDGSTDGSEDLIIKICNRNRNFDYISFERNQGLSTALKAGFDWVKSPLLGYMDSDLQTIPNDFNLLLEYIDTYDLVIGIRTGRKDNLIKRKSSQLANWFRRLFTRDGITDTGCPLKVFKTEFAKRIPMFKGIHRFLPAMIILQKGRVHQVAVNHFPRMRGSGKFGIWNRMVGPFMACFVYLWMKRNYIDYNLKNRS